MENRIQQEKGLQSFSLYNIAFTVTDLDRSIEWYKNVFGFRLVSRSVFSVPAGEAEAAIIQAGEIKFEMLYIPGGKRIEELFAVVPLHLVPIGNKFIVFQVDDIAVTTKELEEKGVDFVWREQRLVGNAMLSTMVQDLDGNKINIFQTNTILGNERWDEPVDAEKIVKEHLYAWSETDGEKRNAVIDRLYAPDVQIVDPFFKIKGIDRLNELISQLQKDNPGFIFSIDGQLNHHHNMIKFNWKLGPENNPSKMTGTDVIHLENGMIKSLEVFINN